MPPERFLSIVGLTTYLFSGRVRALPKHIQQSPYETDLFRPEDLEFSLVQPDAFAAETLVNVNAAESNLFKLHSALRAFHEVNSALSLPLFSRESYLPLFRQFPPPLCFLDDVPNSVESW